MLETNGWLELKSVRYKSHLIDRVVILLENFVEGVTRLRVGQEGKNACGGISRLIFRYGGIGAGRSHVMVWLVGLRPRGLEPQYAEKRLSGKRSQLILGMEGWR